MEETVVEEGAMKLLKLLRKYTDEALLDADTASIEDAVNG